MAATASVGVAPPGLVYVIGRALYVSLTNRCNSVSLPATRGKGFTMSTPLPPLVSEPSAAEISAAVNSAWLERENGYEAIVFAGLGEPTLRLDVLVEAANSLKEKAPLRLNTNGLGNAQHGRDISGVVHALRHFRFHGRPTRRSPALNAAPRRGQAISPQAVSRA
jgi:uncharacterized radical SAM superfamily Fe-S cluster-containing enzyme